MAQFSIGVCTPIPLVPVAKRKILIEKIKEAAILLDEKNDRDGCLKALRESLVHEDKKEMHLGLITPEWHRARTNLVKPPGHSIIEVFADGMEVGVARCSAVKAAREAGLKYLFFIDWDTLIPADSLLKLSYFLDNNPDHDIASGMYCMKSIPPFPLLWRDWNKGIDFDWTLGDRMEQGIVGIPMGCCLLRLSLFDKLPMTDAKPWFKTVDEPVFVGGSWGRMIMTEDLWFTKRFTDEVDVEHKRIMVDTSIWCDHIDHNDGRRYTLGSDTLPVKRARQAGRLPLDLPAEKKKVLHVGCGTEPLPKGAYQDYAEVRLDINPDVKPDIVGSMTRIPVQNEMFDDVFSKHNLEHLPISEVPTALEEFSRALKPGGKVWIEVPDIQAVTEAIPDVGLEGVLYEAPCGPVRPIDVIFGLQSVVDSGNKYYEHKCAFTQQTLHNALVAADFINVSVERNEYALVAHAMKA